MKKIIALVVIGLLLFFSSIVYANYKYNTDKIINMVKNDGIIMELSPIDFIAYLEFHTANRNKNHISYYLSTFWLKPDPKNVALMAIIFIKEEWILDGDIWTINRYIASDRFVTGIITEMECGSLKEKIDGQILEINNLKCSMDDKVLVEEVILKVSPKKGA